MLGRGGHLCHHYHHVGHLEEAGRVAYRLIVLVDPLARQHHHLTAVVGKPATVATVDSHPEANKVKLRKPNNEGKIG